MPVDSMSMRALMGMVQALETPGNCKRLVHLLNEAVDRHSRPPFLLGFQIDNGLEHFDRRRVGRSLCASGFAVDGCDLGKRYG